MSQTPHPILANKDTTYLSSKNGWMVYILGMAGCASLSPCQLEQGETLIPVQMTAT